MRRSVLLAAAGLWLACDDGRLSELEAELRTLEEKRVPIELVEKARVEAEQAEAERRSFEQMFLESESREREAVARLEVLEAALAEEQAGLTRDGAERDAERTRVGALARELEARRAELAQKRTTLERRLGEVRRACERLVEVASQIREADPEWATERRIAVLDELVRHLAEANPEDDVLGAIAMDTQEGRSRIRNDRIRDARARAERARARLVAVHGSGGGAAEGACPISAAAGPRLDQAERSTPVR